MTTRSRFERAATLVVPALLVALASCKSDSPDTTSDTTAKASSPAAPAAKAAPAAPGQSAAPAKPIAAGASAPTPTPVGTRAEISDEFTAEVIVTNVVPAERVVTLRREDGVQIDVHVGPDVRNFDRIIVGDTLRVRYKEVLAAEKLAPGTPTNTVDAAMGAARAPEGAKPKAALGAAMRARVKVETIDRERGIVTYSIASGELASRRVRTSEGKKFIDGLVVGDIVQLEFSQAVVLSIESP